jgi:spectrin beta
MKNDSVQGRRLAKVVGSALDSEKMAHEYERLVSDLLAWIEQTIRGLNDRQFPNSLVRVQEKLVEFNRYRVMDKPARFAEKGNYLHYKVKNVPINKYHFNHMKVK